MWPNCNKNAGLKHAIVRDHDKCLEWLVKAGADINQNGYGGVLPLHTAVRHGKYTCAKVLLTAGADVNRRDELETTPLMMTKNIAMTRLLLEAGADVNMVAEFDGTALECAAAAGLDEMVQLLIEVGADVNLYDKNHGKPPISAAAEHVKCLKILIKAGANVNDGDGFSTKPLHQAVYCRATECVLVLLRSGAKLNTKSNCLTVSLNSTRPDCRQLHMLLFAAGEKLEKTKTVFLVKI